MKTSIIFLLFIFVTVTNTHADEIEDLTNILALGALAVGKEALCNPLKIDLEHTSAEARVEYTKCIEDYNHTMDVIFDSLWSMEKRVDNLVMKDLEFKEKQGKKKRPHKKTENKLNV